MKRRMIFAIFIIMGFLTLGAMNVYASNVRVYHDGVQVDYSKVLDESGVVVLPQIVRDRLMVPIRQTTEIFSIDLKWDPSTNTMTMTKDGVVSVHTIYTSTVTINGVTKTYDMPSMVIDGRTLMPNIMIADIINCDTYWDNSTRSVIMRSRPKALPKPEVVSATSNKQQVMVGEELIVNAMTNQYATNVNLLDYTGRVLATSSQYVQTGDFRSFTLRYSPTSQTISAIQYKIEAGDSSGYNKDATKSVLVSVTKGISVISATVDSDKPYLNENAKFVITTTDGVTRIKFTDKSTNEAYELTNYVVANSAGDRTFSFELKMKEKGDKTFSIEIGTNSFYVADSKTVSLTVQNERPSDPISVKEIVYDNKTYYQGDTVKVSVRTSLSATEVEVYDQYTRNTSRYTSYKDSSSYRTFEVSVKLNTTGSNSYTATAYDRDNKKSEKSFSISTNNSNYGTLIQSVTHTKNSNNYVVTVYTNTDVTSIEILDEYGYPYYSYNPSSYGSNQYRWTITVPYSSSSSQYMYIYAVDKFYQTEYYDYLVY